MKSSFYKILITFSLFTLVSCKKNDKAETTKIVAAENTIKYASGLAIYKYNGYSVVKVSNPWVNANRDFTYVLKEKNAVVPDSLQNLMTIPVPLKSIVVTSTTNIPFLEMLG